MKEIVTIEPDIQDKILNILPDDGTLALKLMSQLTANMLISIKNANYADFITNLKNDLALYEGT